MLNIENQFKQHEKEVYIANRVIDKLLFENCTQGEYRNILKIVEEQLLGKGVYDGLECDEKDTPIFEINSTKILDFDWEETVLNED